MKIDVKHIAKLANLTLNDEEIPKFEKQLSDILTYIETLNKLNTEKVNPTYQVTGLTNVLRTDEKITESLSQEEALKPAHKKSDGYFVVDQILEEK
jgi:aspartyl-tRNA(Asn)/glutamyl-tRNA(Gln) amidotransferase subunit C